MAGVTWLPAADYMHGAKAACPPHFLPAGGPIPRVHPPPRIAVSLRLASAAPASLLADVTPRLHAHAHPHTRTTSAPAPLPARAHMHGQGFLEVYEHASSNAASYEAGCFLRLFILRDLLRTYPARIIPPQRA